FPRVDARVFRCLALAALLGALSFDPATARAQTCTPPPEDCVASAARFEGATRSTPADVADAMRFVAGYRTAACLARRACLIGDGDLARVQAWSDAELGALANLDEAGRTTWRGGLASRVPGMHTPAAALVPTPPPNPSANPAVLEQVVRLRDELEQLDRITPLLDEAERGTRTGRALRTPAACTSDLRERLQAMVRQGMSMASSHAGTLRQKLDALCERFERWERPSEHVENRTRSFLSTVDRAERYLNEVVACYTPGPYDGRCRNAYGDTLPDGLRQARAALREIEAVRRVIRHVPGRPFPCRDAIWQRLIASRWSLRTAEAQITGIGRAALGVCETIGLGDEDLARVHREIDDHLERTRAQLAQTRATTRTTLDNLRRLYRLD
ncbi:MAG: hypothetical protein KC586_31350, partial [Myxococcales bacterium]|nr:hypothetical protein [Myxococcales bacterium]